MNIRAALLLLFVLLAAPLAAHAQDHTYGNTTATTIHSVYDGDTFRCTIANYPAIIGEEISVRVAGIDTPEMKDKRPEVKALAVKARDYVRQRLSGASVVELRNIRRRKYFRLVADVWVDGADLAGELIRLGLAKRYGGGRKPEW